jgi:hypothetical protein
VLKTFLLMITVAISFPTFASHPSFKRCEGFAPPNKLWIPADSKARGISHATFDKILDRMEANYTGEIAARGAILKINRLWTDGTVNSDADQEGQYWIINSYGGLARYKNMTEDGYAMVACHEMGHHLGGAPKFSDPDGAWGAVEGEADYYATLKCMRRILQYEDNRAFIKKIAVHPIVRTRCYNDYDDDDAQALCIRISMASYMISESLRDMEGDKQIYFSRPDRHVMRQLYEDHPAAQCRLDTYFHGALCKTPVFEALDDKDYRPGSCYDRIAQADGVRPRCWFNH